MRNRILLVNHGPAAQRAQVVQVSEDCAPHTVLRTELLPPHTQQEILFNDGQYVIVKGDSE